jgi:hypothetical protein
VDSARIEVEVLDRFALLAGAKVDAEWRFL